LKALTMYMVGAFFLSKLFIKETSFNIIDPTNLSLKSTWSSGLSWNGTLGR